MRSKDHDDPGKKAPQPSRRAWTTPKARRIATSSAELTQGIGPDAEHTVS